MSETKGKLIPFYLVVDVSYSMTEQGRIESANRIIGELVQAFEANPIISDKVRVGMIDFSDDAQVVIPLDDLLDLQSIPQLTVRGGTSYGAAFTKLRSEIERNVNELRASGYEVHRPAVYFITDGVPTDDGWEHAFQALTQYDKVTRQGFSFYPNLIPCGVGDANPAILASLIHPQGRMKMFLQKEGGDPAKALSAMVEIIISSTINSGNNVAQGKGSAIELPMPEDLPEGIEMSDGDDYLHD